MTDGDGRYVHADVAWSVEPADRCRVQSAPHTWSVERGECCKDVSGMLLTV